MTVAKPCQLKTGQPKVADCLKATMAELRLCQSDSDIQRVASKVEMILTSLSNGTESVTDRQSLLTSMGDAKSRLIADGQGVKANRIGKMLKLLAKLPKQSTKKQRKTLREILTLVGKNVGVNIGKRSICGSGLCSCTTAITGSILVLTGAAVAIAMASGAFDETIIESVEAEEPEVEENLAGEEYHNEAAKEHVELNRASEFREQLDIRARRFEDEGQLKLIDDYQKELTEIEDDKRLDMKNLNVAKKRLQGQRMRRFYLRHHDTEDDATYRATLNSKLSDIKAKWDAKADAIRNKFRKKLERLVDQYYEDQWDLRNAR